MRTVAACSAKRIPFDFFYRVAWIMVDSQRVHGIMWKGTQHSTKNQKLRYFRNLAQLKRHTSTDLR